MLLDAPIFVTGHLGMVGAAMVRRLQADRFSNILVAPRDQLDLRDGHAVDRWFAEHRPRYVIHIAGRVGGILANARHPADFLYDNLLIHATVLRAAHTHGAEKLLYLGSACIYPRDAPQPIKEEYFMTGPLEPTNYGYAIAKISGMMSCWAYRDQYGCNFISAMPTNLYGPGDKFDPESSHVIPGLIRRLDDARRWGAPSVTIWGDGTPLREFLHVDDLADALLFLMRHYDQRDTVNIGSGQEVTIAELVQFIRREMYPEVEVRFDRSRPGGAPRKLLDSSRLASLGWRARISLAEGIASTCGWYRAARPK